MVRAAVSGAGLMLLVSCGGSSSGNEGKTGGDAWTSASSAPAAPDATEGSAPSGTSTPAGAAAPAPEEHEASFEGTAAPTEKPKPDTKHAALKSVRTGAHKSYDRIVFEFSGDSVPGYHVEYVDKPVKRCASGKAIDLGSNAALRVRFEPVEHGGKEKGRHTKLDVVRELEPVCDKGKRVEWVLGVRASNPYRVLELASPPRVVVDVQHQGEAKSDAGADAKQDSSDTTTASPDVPAKKHGRRKGTPASPGPSPTASPPP